MAGRVRSLWSLAEGDRVCMCRFCTHTFAASMSLAEIGSHFVTLGLAARSPEARLRASGAQQFDHRRPPCPTRISALRLFHPPADLKSRSRRSRSFVNRSFAELLAPPLEVAPARR